MLCLILCPGCGGGAATTPQAGDFDATRAFQALQKQLGFGPRAPNSKGHSDCKDYLFAELKQYSNAVTLQEFTSNVQGVDYPLANIIAVFQSPLARQRSTSVANILLAAHWDTRPTADRDPDPSKRSQPIPGANDGASGVAVLLEIARVLHEHPVASTVTLVLFDGEDFGNYLYGSTYFADHLPSPKPDWGILLDMIGDADLNLYQEWNSLIAASDKVALVWGAASDLDYRQFIAQPRYTITDDHVPLIRKGIPCIDVIDFDYPYWHTLADTADKCTAASLKAVGETVLKVLREQ